MSLEKYSGQKSRHTCPSCGKAKTFTLYLNDDKIINENVGRCNREINCGYNYTPKEYFKNKGELKNSYNTFLSPNKMNVEKPISFVSIDVLKKSLNSQKNNFIDFLLSRFPTDIVKSTIEQYYIGSSSRWSGATVFWQIDKYHKIRAGKIMLFDKETCKRKKSQKDSIDWITTEGFKQCLFGEHLLNKNNKKVVIVEGEKTAIIGSIYYPKFIWLACGGLNFLTKEKMQNLFGREIKLIPDLKGTENWKKKAEEFKESIKGLNIFVVDRLEQLATDEQKEAQEDIADFLLSIPYHTNENFKKIETETQIDNDGIKCVSICKNEFLNDIRKNNVEGKIDLQSKNYADYKTNNNLRLNEILDFFEKIELPKGPYKFDQCTLINDLNKFVHSHIENVKNNSLNHNDNQFIRRLEILKAQLIISQKYLK